nr:MAG TPA: hypothetical protein [Caudoviricetes sp.]
MLLKQRHRPPDPARVSSVITDIAITLMLIACLTAGFFIIRPRGNHHRYASLLNPARRA